MFTKLFNRLYSDLSLMVQRSFLAPLPLTDHGDGGILQTNTPVIGALIGMFKLG